MHVRDKFDTGEKWYHIKIVWVIPPWEGWTPYLRERPVA